MGGNIIQWKEIFKRRLIWFSCVTLSRLLKVSVLQFLLLPSAKNNPSQLFFFFFFFVLRSIAWSSLSESRGWRFEDQSCALRTAQGRNGNNWVLADMVGLLN